MARLRRERLCLAAAWMAMGDSDFSLEFRGFEAEVLRLRRLRVPRARDPKLQTPGSLRKYWFKVNWGVGDYLLPRRLKWIQAKT